MSLALFVLQSKKLSNLVLPLNIEPRDIHTSTVNVYMYARHVVLGLDMDSTMMSYPLAW